VGVILLWVGGFPRESLNPVRAAHQHRQRAGSSERRAAQRGQRPPACPPAVPDECCAAAGKNAPGAPAVKLHHRHRGTMEFLPGEFRHDRRVAALLVPCWVVLLMFGGKTTTGILAVGLIVAYMFDLSNVREGSLIVIWLTLLGVALALMILVAILLGNNAYLLFLMGCMFLVVFLTGSWMTLQFLWLQRETPAMIMVLERLVVGGTPLPCAVILTWAAGALCFLPVFVFVTHPKIRGMSFDDFGCAPSSAGRILCSCAKL
jgi:hypothetical protein